MTIDLSHLQKNDQGKHDLALDKLSEALAIRSNALGPDHVDVSSTQYKMALVYEERQEYLKVHVYTHTHTHIHTHTHTHILTLTHTHANTLTHTSTVCSLCVHARTHTHTHTHTCSHIMWLRMHATEM